MLYFPLMTDEISKFLNMMEKVSFLFFQVYLSSSCSIPLCPAILTKLKLRQQTLAPTCPLYGISSTSFSPQALEFSSLPLFINLFFYFKCLPFSKEPNFNLTWKFYVPPHTHTCSSSTTLRQSLSYLLDIIRALYCLLF